jgi:succinoglycan biosynthesis transport protein ExoP
LVSHILKLFEVQEDPVSETAKTTIEEEQMIEGFLGMISVTPIRDSRLVDISAIATNREQAALIANTVAETYSEQNLESKVAASRDAVRWLVDEVEQARKKVADSEIALQQYREQNAIISFDDRQNIVMQKLANMSAAANDARIKRIALEA